MSRINIQYATDELIATLHENAECITQKLIDQPNSNSWLKSFTSDVWVIKKKFEVEDFELKIPSSTKDYDTIYKNAITLYEHLCGLPGYVLSDERFWVWLTMEKFYQVSLATMTVTKPSTYREHWIFTESNQRSIFFGVLSRLFFRVELSFDIDSPDPYKYTKFCFENQYRLREMTWRTYSSERHIVRGALKGIKDFLDKYDKIQEDNSSYKKLASDISLLGSAKLLDAMPEEHIREQAFKSLQRYYKVC